MTADDARDEVLRLQDETIADLNGEIAGGRSNLPVRVSQGPTCYAHTCTCGCYSYCDLDGNLVDCGYPNPDDYMNMR